MNLCLNARDAMANGGILQIEASNAVLGEEFVSRYPPAQPGEYLMLRITDNGVGIPDALLEKIFDPFFTTKETGKGTGLGLSTVLGIVKRHGGFLEVNRRPYSTWVKGKWFSSWTTNASSAISPARF